ncbi:FeoC-like transcriptional regulator [Aliikangiella sp. G2MR2-5]|uniref:FeoC-like transcriptional regulator n=1 Tax=Aliikangiella sp. G2MR2-5 TaxID=2788943 RepID=UPI0018A9C7C7|nr:FeoC-like transcriptional regulator [Aliikangiella sp. G2MR2-5]
MLMEIKKLLEERDQMTLTDLARHFYVSENVMQSMVDQWIRKGRIEKVELSGLCGSSCGSCDEAGEVKILYRWKKVAQKGIYTQQA